MNINEEEIEFAKDVGRYVLGGGTSALLLRFVWKVLNKFTSQADSSTAKNNAEETLWQRLQEQITALQESERVLDQRVEELRTIVESLRIENARLHEENKYLYKKNENQSNTIDELLTEKESLELMMQNVKVIDKDSQ